MIALEELCRRFVEQMLARPSGPMSFRFAIQPTIACLLAIRAGRRDARQGRPPYLWAILSEPADRLRHLQSGWQDIAKLFAMAIVLDAVYQLLELRGFYPLESLVIAVALAVLPYALVRGPVTRIARPRPAIRSAS